MIDYTRLRTVQQLTQGNSAFTEPSLRWLIFKARENGLEEAGAIVRVNRRVLIDLDAFEAWLEERRAK